MVIPSSDAGSEKPANTIVVTNGDIDTGQTGVRYLSTPMVDMTVDHDPDGGRLT